MFKRYSINQFQNKYTFDKRREASMFRFLSTLNFYIIPTTFLLNATLLTMYLLYT